MLKGKRRIERIQSNTDSARLHVNAVNDVLLIVQQEGPHSLTSEECSDLLERLIMAEDAIREAKIALEGGI